jgi:hypothetical protein
VPQEMRERPREMYGEARLEFENLCANLWFGVHSLSAIRS